MSDINTSNNETTKTNTMKEAIKSSVVRGKDISLFAKILGCVFLIATYTISIILNKNIPSIEETCSILLATVGITNVLSFSIDLSLIIKNIKSK